MRVRFLLPVIALVFASSLVRAEGISVISFPTSSPPAWVQISPNTFVLPADLSSVGCGTENEPICEPGALFLFNVGFTTGGSFQILDPSGALSDFILIANGNGLGEVFFASDPTLPVVQGPVPTLCVEGANGCVASVTVGTTNGSTIALTFSSDGENSSDPFGAGFDTSDGFQVTTTSVPEPGNFALLATGLVGLAAALRKKLLT